MVREYIRALINEVIESGQKLDVDGVTRRVKNEFPEHTREEVAEIVNAALKTARRPSHGW